MPKAISQWDARRRIARIFDAAGYGHASEELIGDKYVSMVIAEFTSGVWADKAEVHLREVIRLNDSTVQYRVRVSWSACDRGIASATVALDNYQKALILAARLEAFCDDLPEVQWRNDPEE